MKRESSKTISKKTKFDHFFQSQESSSNRTKMATSSSFNSDLVIICPVCTLSLKNDDCFINLHIDACLKSLSTKNQSNNGDKKCQDENFRSTNKSSFLVSSNANIDSFNYDGINVLKCEQINGLFLIYNFISSEEENTLIQLLDNDIDTPWKYSSFNGHCMSKTFGVKTQFGLPNEERLVRQNDIKNGEFDIPEYLHPFIDRLKVILTMRSDLLPSILEDFQPNDCNANSYLKSEKHSLTPHFDDRALSGPILMNLSMGCTSRMTYTKPNTNISIPIELPSRTLQLVTCNARYDYMHEIKPEDILGVRRVSLTWRQSGGKRGIREIDKLKQTVLK